MLIYRPLVVCMMAALCGCAVHKSDADWKAILSEIEKIKAIDNHAHPVRPALEGQPPDDEYDALSMESFDPFPLPVRMRPTNPAYINVWKTLFKYPYEDMSPPHIRELIQSKRQAVKEKAEGFPTWVLDQAGIEVMIANRVAMGKSFPASRFRWVPYVDAFLFPLNNGAYKRENPDLRACFTSEEKLLFRYMKEAGMTSLPASFDDYLRKLVDHTLAGFQKNSAVGVKFEAAYLRPLDFERADQTEAGRVYERFRQAGEPPAADYKKLQDFLFRYVAREAGRRSMAVHVHASAGVGAYFKVSGANPMLLESSFNDRTLSKTNFVIVHGGWPYSKQAEALLAKPNVFADFSLLPFLVQPAELAGILRGWLETYPEKVLFGTDAFSLTPEAGWEENVILASRSSRKALSIALAGMLNDGEIDHTQALKLARMVLRENAVQLYKLQ
jgi:predicted TIM-barrel fold metal-dependent hydrolase